MSGIKRPSLLSKIKIPGHTAIELAIALIVIGFATGAVVKGKDIVHEAEQKRVYASFLNPWKTAYLRYNKQTGTIPGRIVDESRSGQDKAAGAAQSGDAGFAPGSSLVEDLERIGSKPPDSNTEKPWMYRYRDKFGGDHEVSIAFAHDATGNYNYMRIENIPNELARAVDLLIDGTAEGARGDFLNDQETAWGARPEINKTARWIMPR